MRDTAVQEAKPAGALELGSKEHLQLLCLELLETHDPCKPSIIDWPTLDEKTRARITSLPIWDIAVQTEGRAGLNVKTFAERNCTGLLRKAVEMNAFEESRHKQVLANMVTFYGITLQPEPEYVVPRDAEWAFMVTGYSECIDSFFGFGLFELAKSSGFFPQELVDTFEPVMREEGRHILFFVNWVAWWRRNMPWWRRPGFELKVLAVWLFLIWERIGTARAVERHGNAADNNFTVSGSKQLGVDIDFKQLARVCLKENDRRLAPYDVRLIRPAFVPWIIRLALRFMKDEPSRGLGPTSLSDEIPSRRTRIDPRQCGCTVRYRFISSRLTRRGPRMRRGGAERVSAARASMAKHSTAIVEILNVEIASALLGCFVLDCCILLAEERRLIQPREDVIARLTAARQEARRLKRLLDPNDAASVHRILEHYLPRVPSQLPRS